MANKAVTLMRLCKTESGWRRYKAVVGKNGRIRPNFALKNGFPTEYIIGHYELRYYEGSKAKYMPVGNDAQAAMTAALKHERLLVAKQVADDAGAKIVEENKRAKLRDVLMEFVRDARDRGADEAAEVNLYAGEEFLSIVEKQFVDQITLADFTKHQAALRKRELAPRTIYNRYTRVCALLRFAGLDEKVFPDKAPKYDKTLPEAYTSEQIKALFASLKTMKKAVTYKTALQCGLREQELMHVEWPDIDWEAKTLRVRSKPKYQFKVKDSEERDLPLTDDLVDLLREYEKTHGNKKLITGTSTDRPNTHLLRELKRQVNKAGLSCRKCDSCVQHKECEDWFLHKFRATYATTLLRKGVDIRSVQKLMGHSDIATTMRYLRPAETPELRAKINAMSW
jgi:integrase